MRGRLRSGNGEAEQSETTALFVDSLVLWCVLLWCGLGLFKWTTGTDMPPYCICPILAGIWPVGVPVHQERAA